MFVWKPQASFNLYVPAEDGRNKLLTVYLSQLEDDGSWVPVALETAKSSERTDAIGIAEETLENHGHRLVGKFETLGGAVKAAEDYARQWLAGVSIVACGCEEITPVAVRSVVP